jgi:hypothetical protein
MTWTMQQIPALSTSQLLSTPKRSMSHFRVISHTIRAQSIRERPGAVKHKHEKDLRLAVKQYIPHDNPKPGTEDVTLIGAHANGFPKVAFPFFLSLL